MTLPRRSARSKLAERRTILAPERCRENLPVHAERDLAAGDLFQLRGQRVIEQEADAERSEDVRLRADEDRHGDELHHPVRLRQEAEALTAREGLADRRLVRHDERRACRDADGGEHACPSCWSRAAGSCCSWFCLAMSSIGDCTVGGSFVSHGGLQLRGVRDEPRHHREGLRLRRAELLDDGPVASISR